MFKPGKTSHDTLFRPALGGVIFAAAVWPAVFRSKYGNFWMRMTLASGVLGLHALRSRPELRTELPTWRDALPGMGSAAGLYAIFQMGDRMARRLMPTGEQDIEDVYRFRTMASKPVIAALLVTVIGPSEELFWRGLVQHACMRRFGRINGICAGTLAYGAVHLGSRNLTLTGAAAVAGGYWGCQYGIRPRLGPLLVSHILWDVWIFLLQPTPTGRDSK